MTGLTRRIIGIIVAATPSKPRGKLPTSRGVSPLEKESEQYASYP